jgi:hypothetical protein
VSSDIDSPRFAPIFLSQDSKLIDCKIKFDTPEDYKNAASKAGYSESRRPFSDDQAGRDELANILKESAGTYKFQISIDGSPFYEVNLKDAFPPGTTTTHDTIQTAIKTKINSALPPSLANTVNVVFVDGPGTTTKVFRLESATADKKSIDIQPASSNDVAKTLMLGTDNGGVEQSRYGFLRPAPTGTFFDISKLNDLSDKPQNHFDTITIDGHPISLQNKLVTTGTATDKWYKSAGNNNDGIREKFAILVSEINNANIGWSATLAGSRLILRKRSGQNNDSSPITTSPNDIGSFFKASTKVYALGTGVGTFIGVTTTGIEGDSPDAGSYIGKESDHSGFYALDNVDLFNLMVIPKDDKLSESDYRSLLGPASAYCKAHRAFLIIDPPDSWKDFRAVLDPSKGIRSLRIGVAKDHAAVYYPKIIVRENGIQKRVGPSGAIAGLYSRSDSSGGGGVWTAPAGVNADILGISDVDVSLTDKENGTLNKEGVNCIRKFASGIVSWGARTMDGADDFTSEWKYIPVRRLALMLGETLFRGTKYAVFRGNDEPLWADIRRNIRAFMMGLFRQNAFQGGSPDKAFFVKCDSETTTQADINLGIVNIVVGFAPLKPAEFVIIKIQQMAGEL